MIGDREQVYENIRTAVSLNQLNSKVEPGDPKLLREDKEALLRHYIASHNIRKLNPITVRNILSPCKKLL